MCSRTARKERKLDPEDWGRQRWMGRNLTAARPAKVPSHAPTIGLCGTAAVTVERTRGEGMPWISAVPCTSLSALPGQSQTESNILLLHGSGLRSAYELAVQGVKGGQEEGAIIILQQPLQADIQTEIKSTD